MCVSRLVGVSIFVGGVWIMEDGGTLLLCSFPILFNELYLVVEMFNRLRIANAELIHHP